MNILFVLNDYYPSIDANGHCAKKVIDILKKDHGVHVLCYSDRDQFVQKDGIAIHCIKTGESLTMSNTKPRTFLQKVTKVISVLPSYPVLNPNLAYRMIRQASKTISQYNIDTVVAVIHPLESGRCMIQLKKKFPNIRTIVYELDSITDQEKKASGLYRLLDYKRKKFESDIYTAADRIIQMRCHEKHYSSRLYDVFRPKITYADFPLFNPDEKVNSRIICIGSEVSMLYSGSFLKQIRTPEATIDVLVALSKSRGVKCDFYSRGDYEEMLRQVSAEYKGVINAKGYVTVEELDAAMEEADCLISIGNEIINMVPSKIYSYIAQAKPIIHFFKCSNDPCIAILGKYSLGLSVDLQSTIKTNVEKIISFLMHIDGMNFAGFSPEDFNENKPEYTSALICGSLHRLQVEGRDANQ